ncbi:MAG: adenosylcobinamide-GDP ribazoletransferase, partial [Rhodospirillaceae bacterium]|nr:adenosylcobinamide-GDP ribazoletransferase [Rhodospirillaceae bacterium]
MPIKPSKPSKSNAAKKNITKKRIGGITRVALEIRTVWVFFTRLPWPGDFFSQEKSPPLKLSEASRTFPFAGVVVGAIGALALFVAATAGLHPLAASMLAIGATALASGAMHEDGLADVADSFGASSKTKKLEIMKDSRVGTYGVLALIIVTGLKVSLLAGFPGSGLAAGALFVAHVLGRSGLGLMMLSLKPVRKSGLAKAAGTPKQEDAMIGVIIGTLIAVLVLGPGT